MLPRLLPTLRKQNRITAKTFTAEADAHTSSKNTQAASVQAQLLKNTDS